MLSYSVSPVGSGEFSSEKERGCIKCLLFAATEVCGSGSLSSLEAVCFCLVLEHSGIDPLRQGCPSQ